MPFILTPGNLMSDRFPEPQARAVCDAVFYIVLHQKHLRLLQGNLNRIEGEAFYLLGGTVLPRSNLPTTNYLKKAAD